LAHAHSQKYKIHSLHDQITLAKNQRIKIDIQAYAAIRGVTKISQIKLHIFLVQKPFVFSDHNIAIWNDKYIDVINMLIKRVTNDITIANNFINTIYRNTIYIIAMNKNLTIPLTLHANKSSNTVSVFHGFLITAVSCSLSIIELLKFENLVY